MNDLIHHLSIPAELKSFAEDTCLLPGESRREFENIRCMIIDDVRPKTHIEWLWILDLAEMSWEILHYRCLKQKSLSPIAKLQSKQYCSDWTAHRSVGRRSVDGTAGEGLELRPAAIGLTDR
jgi:hypothetical protein